MPHPSLLMITLVILMYYICLIWTTWARTTWFLWRIIHVGFHALPVLVVTLNQQPFIHFLLLTLLCWLQSSQPMLTPFSLGTLLASPGQGDQQLAQMTWCVIIITVKAWTESYMEPCCYYFLLQFCCSRTFTFCLGWPQFDSGQIISVSTWIGSDCPWISFRSG